MTTAVYNAALEITGIKSLVKSNGPARYATVVTPSDTVAVAIGPGGTYAKKLYVGVTGDITLITAADQSGVGAVGTPVLFKAVPVGFLDVQVRQVLATGTTATNILGLAD